MATGSVQSTAAETFTISLPSGYEWINFRGRKTAAGIISISGRIDSSPPWTTKSLDLGVILPSDIRPKQAVIFAAFNNSTDKTIEGRLLTQGNMVFYRTETESLSSIVLSVLYVTW